MAFDVGHLLAPIAGEFPAGPNLRDGGEGMADYHRLKDARTAARLAERRADAEDDRGPPAAEWRTIYELAQATLHARSKDLEVATWLTEAALRLHGFPGLRDGLALVDGLIERYWDTLHSVDDEDLAGKVAPLTGLNGVETDGALIQPMRLTPITAPQSGEPAGLWHYSVMRRRPTSPEAALLAVAAKGTSAASFQAIHAAIRGSLAHFSGFTARLDALCGEDAPPSSNVRNTLTDAADALRDVSGLGAALDPVTDTAPDAPAPVSADAVAGPEGGDDGVAPRVEAAPGPAVLHTREDALRELSRIATFFRENEPNSPTGFTLDTLIRRARMPLGELLEELIPDDAARRAYLSAAGIAAARKADGA